MAVAAEEPRTLIELFAIAAKCSGDKKALWWEKPTGGQDADGKAVEQPRQCKTSPFMTDHP